MVYLWNRLLSLRGLDTPTESSWSGRFWSSRHLIPHSWPALGGQFHSYFRRQHHNFWDGLLLTLLASMCLQDNAGWPVPSHGCWSSGCRSRTTLNSAFDHFVWEYAGLSSTWNPFSQLGTVNLHIQYCLTSWWCSFPEYNLHYPFQDSCHLQKI